VEAYFFWTKDSSQATSGSCPRMALQLSWDRSEHVVTNSLVTLLYV